MIFYYICREVVAGSEATDRGFKPGRTLLYDLTQRTPEAARQIADRRNRRGCPQGACYVVISHWSNKPVPCDYHEASPVTEQRILVG